MRYLKYIYLLLGVALLGVVIAQTDLAEVSQQVGRVGWGFLVVLVIYFVAFLIDSITWQLAIPSAPLNVQWTYRAWALRMVGEAFNNVIPAASMGGEPVKAVLLKRHYAIGYREGAASLILARTVNLIALVVFLIIGFALMMGGTVLPKGYQMIAGAGLAGLGVGVGLFFVVQRYGVTSLTGRWISRSRFGKRVSGILHHIHDMDERLVAFYRDNRGRFAVALGLAFANWVLGVVEIYYAMIFLDNPVSWADAWIIEAMAQLVRTGTFFIPASIGAQEGAFLLVCGAITGSPSLGVAVSVVRRLREIIWVVSGFVLASALSLKPQLSSRPDSKKP